MNEETYAALFIDLDYYRLPDGTEAQAIWTGSEPLDGDDSPPYWILVPADNPHDTQAPHMQYEVRRDGTIAAVRSVGEEPIERIGELPRVTFSTSWRTDLTVEDLIHE